MRQDVCGAARKNAQRHRAWGEAINDFVDGSIAATGKDHVSAICHRGMGQFVRHVRPLGGRKLNLQSGLAQYGSGPAQHRGSFTDFAHPPHRTLPRNRIIDEGAFFQIGIWSAILDWNWRSASGRRGQE